MGGMKLNECTWRRLDGANGVKVPVSFAEIANAGRSEKRIRFETSNSYTVLQGVCNFEVRDGQEY
jgi:hypothetical protein